MSVIGFRPHRLQAYERTAALYDEFGGQLSEEEGVWRDIAPCFCHDNGQGEQTDERGRIWTYQYNIAYNGQDIPIGTRVRCLDACCRVVGEGKVKRVSHNHCEGFRGRKELWV